MLMILLDCPPEGNNTGLFKSNICFLLLLFWQNKYKEAGKKELLNSLYSVLPETKETQHAKEQSQLCSEVRSGQVN